MAFIDTIKYDAANPLTSLYEFGETVSYTDSAISPDTKSVRAVFGDEQWEEQDEGGVADVSRVFVPEDELDATPLRKGTVTRDPTGTPLVWVVRRVEHVDGGYLLYVEKDYRPAPATL